MAINKKLIHFKTRAAFEAQLAGSNILDTSIVFIKDANLIWTHGTYYGKGEIYIGTNEPTNGEIIWINSDTDEMKYFDGTQWVIIVGKARVEKETLVINLASNQTNPDSNLNGVIVNVRYLDIDHEQVWEGEALSFNIPNGTEYTIEYSDIVDENGNKIYTTPTMETHIAVGNETRTLSRYYTGCKLTVQRTNNQGATMSTATSATVTYSSYSQTVNFTSSTNSVTITIPYDVSYTIKFNGAITNYRTPINITGTSNSTAITEVGSYDSEFLTVNVSGLASGFTITVNGQSQTATSGTYYIAYGTAYTISASSVKGYTATVSESSITANSKTRTVTVTYAKLVNGVYICDTSGTLTDVGSWNTANNSSAIGVAVVSNKCSFVIGKTQSNNNIKWSSKVGGTNVPGIKLTSSSSEAILDYVGEANSSIVRSKTSGEDNAFNWAYDNTITVNGTTLHGYIGACGEWKTAQNNKAAVDSVLSIIGGTALGTEYYWCSTQYSSKEAWKFGWDADNPYYYNKNGYYGSSYIGGDARAFYPIP